MSPSPRFETSWHSLQQQYLLTASVHAVDAGVHHAAAVHAVPAVVSQELLPAKHERADKSTLMC